MKGKDYLAFLNLAGAVSSILALLLTLSQNVTFAIVIKSLVAIVFFIATIGTLGRFAYLFNKEIIKSNYWPYHLLYWLIIGMLIIILALIVADLSYQLTTVLIGLFSSTIVDVKNVNF